MFEFEYSILKSATTFSSPENLDDTSKLILHQFHKGIWYQRVVELEDVMVM